MNMSETPNNTPRKDNKKTPRKVYNTLCLTPKSRGKLCWFCGKLIETTNDRRRLVENKGDKKGQKTLHCQNIEKLTGLSLDPSPDDIICKYCAASVNNTLAKIKNLVDKFYTTQANILENHGKEVVKRGRQETPQKQGKRQKVRTALDFDATSIQQLTSTTQTSDNLPGDENILYKVNFSLLFPYSS